MNTDPGEQEVYQINIGKAWAKQIHDQEVNLLWHMHSMDEAALEESELLPAKVSNPMPELATYAVAANLPQLSDH